jgi:phosphatidylserine/phosphatidylglycerophosphate/cardiolipin synthase-like enzyme
VPAPACTSKKARFFSSCHEKFIVIDGTWTLVQSGNYSNNSIPLNEKDGGDPANFVKGNRDTGLAVKSKKLAKFFTTVLNSDIALELNAPETRLVSAPTPTEAVWVEAAPKLIPKRLFPSKRFGLSTPLTVQPVLSPDNYMSVIPAMLSSARKSILIEQQYIRASQEKITVLLQAMRAAMDANPALDVRIVLGKVFGPDDIAREKANLKLLKDTYGLALGSNVRFIDTKRFVHCHNKMIIVDGDTVLVSSQNWSDSAVSKNREAGLLLTHKGIGKYFTGVFESDWETAQTKLPEPSGPSVEPEALRAGGYIQVVPADYREV